MQTLVCDKAVVGTLQVHAVVPVVPSHSIAVRGTSCFEPCCWEDNKSVRQCPGWTEHKLFAADPRAVQPPQQEEEEEDEPVPAVESYDIGDYVTCRYNTKWYLGRVIAGADQDGEVRVSFMEGPSATSRQFVWPPRKDIIYVPVEDIVVQTSAPEPVGRRRLATKFRLPDSVLEEVDTKFSRM